MSKQKPKIKTLRDSLYAKVEVVTFIEYFGNTAALFQDAAEYIKQNKEKDLIKTEYRHEGDRTLKLWFLKEIQ